MLAIKSYSEPFRGLTVPAGVTLTVDPGVLVKMITGSWCLNCTNDNQVGFEVDGSLVVAGTAASPVTFTSIHDDSVGGDTNSDGGASVPSPNEWNGISAGAGGSLSLDHVVVGYAGVSVGGNPAGPVSITNSLIHDGNGINVSESTLTLASTEVSSTVGGAALALSGMSSTSTVSNITVASAPSGISVTADATLNADSVTLTNISGAAVTVSGTSTAATLSDASINGSAIGLDVTSGDLTYRGSIQNSAMGAKSCNWGSGGCLADAAYTDWSSPAGPYRSDGTALTCGSVTTMPWVGMTGSSSPFAPGNCDGSPTPDQQLAQAAADADNRITHACDGLGPDVCDVAAIYARCLSAATTLAQQQLGVPTGGYSDQLNTVAQQATGLVGDAMQTSELPTVANAGQALSFASGVFSAIGSIFSLITAYNSCHA
jgi:hypothetical protein